MKTTLTLASSALLALSIGNAFAAPAAVKAPLKKAQPTFLFSMYAKQGKIKKLGTDLYALQIERSNVSSLIEFSNRPYRIVENISVNFLAQQWKEKTNNFTENSPNVAISGANLKPHIVVMTGMKADPTAISYLLKAKTPIKAGTYSNMSFFIDGSDYGCYGIHPHGGCIY